jgi:pimeloyl-ACP methyl ester carboxylesterase
MEANFRNFRHQYDVCTCRCKYTHYAGSAFAAGVTGALSFRGSLRGRSRASSTATDATPAGKLVEQYYRTAVAIFKVGGPWLGRTLLHPRVDLAFRYAQWKCNVDLELLELVSPETLLPATTVPVLLIHGRDNRNTKKTLITKARVVLERSFA